MIDLTNFEKDSHNLFRNSKLICILFLISLLFFIVKIPKVVEQFLVKIHVHTYINKIITILNYFIYNWNLYFWLLLIFLILYILIWVYEQINYDDTQHLYLNNGNEYVFSSYSALLNLKLITKNLFIFIFRYYFMLKVFDDSYKDNLLKYICETPSNHHFMALGDFIGIRLSFIWNIYIIISFVWYYLSTNKEKTKFIDENNLFTEFIDIVKPLHKIYDNKKLFLRLMETTYPNKETDMFYFVVKQNGNLKSYTILNKFKSFSESYLFFKTYSKANGYKK